MLTTKLVGRETEILELQHFLQTTLTNHGQICFVIGEAGSGKTTLINEFTKASQSKNEDIIVAIGNCDSTIGLGDPYLPFREILNLLTGDVEGKLEQGSITASPAWIK